MEFYVARVSLFDPLAMAVAFVAPASRALTGPAIPGLALPITGRTWRPPVGAQSPAGGATEPIVGKDTVRLKVVHWLPQTISQCASPLGRLSERNSCAY